MKNKKSFLIILDGWGHGREDNTDAIFNADTPYFDSLLSDYPHAELLTDGKNVGLPKGQMGNSEVGHLNLGAGRVVFQELLRINQAIENHQLRQNPEICAAIDYAIQNHKAIHFMGLVSDGGVHSHIRHLEALIDIAEEAGVQQFYVHAFTDGRDTDPKSGHGFIKNLEAHLSGTHGQLATLIGRYYAMDRDKRWERTSAAYRMLVQATGRPVHNILSAIQDSYDAGVTDEFIHPLIKTNESGVPIASIHEDDVVFCFNFRTDRPRQIISALTQEDYPDFNMQKLPLYTVTMTSYDEKFKGLHIVYKQENVPVTLGEYLSQLGRSQLRIAETEKYPHVTFFFSGGREKPFKGEKRVMIPSPKVATYDLQPEMNAFKVKDAAIKEMNEKEPDFICLNFANADMVGHTGVFSAAMKACETVDQCLSELIPVALTKDYGIILLADHGNSDYLINEDGSPNTAHSLNPVPVILVDNQLRPSLQQGILSDVAPTLLKMMNLKQPDEMSGQSLY